MIGVHYDYSILFEKIYIVVLLRLGNYVVVRNASFMDLTYFPI